MGGQLFIKVPLGSDTLRGGWEILCILIKYELGIDKLIVL